MKKLSLEKFMKANAENLDLKKISGGYLRGGTTLDTITVTPSGTSNDGSDPEADLAAEIR